MKLSTTVSVDQALPIIEATGIPFQRTALDLWSLQHGYDIEPGDGLQDVLEYKGPVIARAQMDALKRLTDAWTATGTHEEMLHIGA